MNNVSYVRLKELCTVNQGLQIPISKRFRKNGPNRYFYITVQFLKVGHIEKYFIEKPPISSICNEDDILVVRTGSTGQILTGIEGCFHNNFFKVNFNKNKILGKYLYYCLTTREKQKEIKQRAGVTVISDLNHFLFLDIKIPLIPLEKQTQVVRILDSIFTKIKVNKQINAKLEAMAKTLYEYWFVQFDFPNAEGKPYKSTGGKMVYNEELKREIPEGWEAKRLQDIAKVKAGGDKPKSISTSRTNKFKVPIFSNGTSNDGLYGYTNEAKINKKSITISARGTIGYTVLRNEPYYPIIRLISVIPKIESTTCFYYYEIKNLVYENSGSVQQQLTVPQISRLFVIKPKSELVEKYEAVVSLSHAKIHLNKKQNQKLAELRDWLLPMLMNGQVTVGEAQDYVHQARSNDLDMVAEEKDKR